MKQLLIILSICAVSSTAFGQADHTIFSDGNREVEPAYRIALKPQIVDTVIPTPVVNYPLLPLQYETTTELEKINPANIKTVDKLAKLYSTYIKLGVGTELMPLGEVYFDAKRSRKYIYGAHLKHLSSFGDLPDYAAAQFDRTRLNLYGGINEKRYSLRGDIHYNNQGLHYYGIKNTGLNRDSISQRFSDFGIGAMFKSHKKDSATLNYRVGLNYNNFLSKKPEDASRETWRVRENFFGISSGAWYRHGSEIYAADLNIHYNGYKYGELDSAYKNPLDTGIVLNNTVINLRPSITTHLFNNKFKAKVGLDLTLNAHSVKTRAHIYPIAEVKYSLFNDIFIPYVGIRGGMTQNTFKGLAGQNEFILPNIVMRNEHKAIDFYGGIKGTLSKRISFNAGIGFANIKDMALFVTDTVHSLGNQFNVIFDTASVTTVEASISYQLKEKFKVDAIGRFYSYSLLNNSYAWNKPNLQVILRGSYNLFDKFLFNLDLDIEQGRRALVYAMEDGVTEENGQLVKKLDFIADVNLGVEYRYNKRISAFVQFNNIASQRYQRWNNTPVQSFQFLGGVTFRL